VSDTNTQAGDAQAGDEPVAMMDFFMHLEYHEVVAPNFRRYGEALMDEKIIGGKCPGSCGLIYVPPRSFCPIDVVAMTEANDVELAQTGTVTNYTVVAPVQYYGQEETEPFVRASITLDPPGGSLMLQDILDVPVDQVRSGMRVRAVWLEQDKRSVDEIDNRAGRGAPGLIRGWEPTGEPDVPEGQYHDEGF
jgi:uncharacterized OB-fold protein